MKEQEVIQFNNRPEVVEKFVQGWLEAARKDKKSSAAYVSVLEDIVKLIGLAQRCLQPQQEGKA